MFKPRYANKSFARLTIPGLAVTGFVGGYFYYRTPTASPSTGGQAERTRQKRDKEALGGAGIGGNAMSGGHETGQPGSGVQPGTGDVERSVKTDAPKEMLPRGGVGGGYGGGNSNLRAIDMTAKEDTSAPKGSGSGSSSDSSKLTAKLDSGDSSTSSSASDTSGTGASTNKEALGTDSADYKVRSQPYPTSKDDHNASSKTESSQGLSLSQRLQGAFGQGGKSSGERGENEKKYQDTRIHSNHADTPTKRHKMRSDS